MWHGAIRLAEVERETAVASTHLLSETRASSILARITRERLWVQRDANSEATLGKHLEGLVTSSVENRGVAGSSPAGASPPFGGTQEIDMRKFVFAAAAAAVVGLCVPGGQLAAQTVTRTTVYSPLQCTTGNCPAPVRFTPAGTVQVGRVPTVIVQGTPVQGTHASAYIPAISLPTASPVMAVGYTQPVQAVTSQAASCGASRSCSTGTARRGRLLGRLFGRCN